MKTVRMLAVAIALAISLGTEGRTQSTDELEAAGRAHFRKAYYEALPKQRPSEAAAEFQKALAHAACHNLSHRSPHTRTACRADQWNVFVRGQSLADLRAADQDLYQIIRACMPGLLEPCNGTRENFLARNRRQRRFFGRLPDHRIAADNRQRGIP